MAHITRYGFWSLCFGPLLDSLFLCVKYLDQICGPAISWRKGGMEAGGQAGRLLTSPALSLVRRLCQSEQDSLLILPE